MKRSPFYWFFYHMQKGTVMTLTLENGDGVRGQYALMTVGTYDGQKEVTDGRVCLYTERMMAYEYFPYNEIKSVLVERAENAG